MQSVIAGVVLGLTCWALSACEMDSSVPPKSYRGLPFLSIPKLDAPEKLSGDLSAAVWSRAAAVALNDPRGAAPSYTTEARVFCTRDALYVGFRCAEPTPDALSVSDPEIWKRDEVEIFLEPYEETLKRPYHHLMIDASGSTASGRYHIYPRYFRLKSGEQKWTPRLEIATAKSASGWTLEVRIPFDQIVFSDAAQSKDALWRLNFCRSRPARGTDPAMTWSWSPLNSTAFQTPWRFGYALPEVFATDSLRARVTAHPNADALADSNSERVNDPVVVSTIEAGLNDLTADGKFDAGMARLKPLACESPALYELIVVKANDRLKTRGGAVRRDLQEFLYQLDRSRPDEDPPADDVLAMIAQFEPHTFSDAAGKSLNYRLLKPANFDPQKKYPLVLFMHGSGECGGDNWRQLFGGCLTYLREDIRAKYPSFVLAPQCPLGSQWPVRGLIRFRLM